jgi:hypothetical protein
MDLLRSLAGVSVAPVAAPAPPTAPDDGWTGYAFEDPLPPRAGGGVTAGPGTAAKSAAGKAETDSEARARALKIVGKLRRPSDDEMKSIGIFKEYVTLWDAQYLLGCYPNSPLQLAIRRVAAKEVVTTDHYAIQRDEQPPYVTLYVRGSSIYNKSLRHGYVSEITADHVCNLVEALNTKGMVVEPTYYWRGMSQWQDLEVGSEICDPAFMSKSTNIDNAYGFAERQEGASGVLCLVCYPKYSVQMFFNAKELEVLSYPGERFKVVDIGTIRMIGVPQMHLLVYLEYVGNMYGDVSLPVEAPKESLFDVSGTLPKPRALFVYQRESLPVEKVRSKLRVNPAIQKKWDELVGPGGALEKAAKKEPSSDILLFDRETPIVTYAYDRSTPVNRPSAADHIFRATIMKAHTDLENTFQLPPNEWTVPSPFSSAFQYDFFSGKIASIKRLAAKQPVTVNMYQDLDRVELERVSNEGLITTEPVFINNILKWDPVADFAREGRAVLVYYHTGATERVEVETVFKRSNYCLP